MVKVDHGKVQKLVDRMDEHHRNAYEHLINILKNNILAFQDPAFSDYTDHSLNHSFRVSEQLAMMIPNSFLYTDDKEKSNSVLNSLEIFILLCSAWLHDIGMLWNRINPDKKLPPSEVRDRHHELSRDYIRDDWEILFPTFTPPVAEKIGDVCYCHRRKVDIDTVFPDEFEPLVSDMVRARLLAALVRIADAYDADPRKVPLLFIDLKGLVNEYSKREWQKHQLIEGIGYDPDKKHTIIISSRRIDNENNRSLFLEKCKDLYTEYLSVRDILLQYKINYSSMTVKVNEFGTPPTTKEWNAGALFPNPIPSWEALQNAANEASQRIIKEMSSIGKYVDDLYISREDIEASFRVYIDSNKIGFALVGPSGAGKTNIFCHLAKEYGQENIVLFYNGAYLTTPDIEKHIEKDLSGYCIKQALDIAIKNNRYFIILVDGLNDYYVDPGSLLRYINDIIGRIDNPHLKVAFTCRSIMWSVMFDYERIALYRTKFFAPEGELEIFLPRFTREELTRVYPLYKKRFELLTDLDDLPEETKEMLQDPLILRLVCETHKGGI